MKKIISAFILFGLFSTNVFSFELKELNKEENKEFKEAKEAKEAKTNNLFSYYFEGDYVESLRKITLEEEKRTGLKFVVFDEVKDKIVLNNGISITAPNLYEAVSILGENIGKQKQIKTIFFANNTILITK